MRLNEDDRDTLPSPISGIHLSDWERVEIRAEVTYLHELQRERRERVALFGIGFGGAVVGVMLAAAVML